MSLLDGRFTFVAAALTVLASVVSLGAAIALLFEHAARLTVPWLRTGSRVIAEVGVNALHRRSFAPQRLLSFTAISSPHLDGFAKLRMDPSSCQAAASSYMAEFVASDASGTK